MNKVLWLVDENAQELITYAEMLQRALPDSLQVRPILAREHREDYMDILNSPDTVALVLDQKLKDTGIAQYTGIELAAYVRALKTKLPVYILTNYADDIQEFAGGEWSVEDIIAKDCFQSRELTETIVARLLRRVDVYEDILTSRAKRLRDLLMKGSQEDLNSEEIKELSELQFQDTSPTIAEEMSKLKQLDELLAKQAVLLKQLNELNTKAGS